MFIANEKSCGYDKQCPEEANELFQTVLKELCLISETTTEVNQRCVDLNLQLDRTSIQHGYGEEEEQVRNMRRIKDKKCKAIFF